MTSKWPISWELRNSESHPLQIDWITHPNFSGQIGITLCPGKYQPISWSGGWNRDLISDINTIVDSNVTTLISLIDHEEIEILRVNDLGKIVQSKGIKWIHLPLEDTTAPDEQWLKTFFLLLPSITHELESGNSILIHCKGGLSRAGTCAAMLLHSFRVSIVNAIKLIRTSRSENCINSEQVNFLFEFANNYETIGLSSIQKWRRGD